MKLPKIDRELVKKLIYGDVEKGKISWPVFVFAALVLLGMYAGLIIFLYGFWQSMLGL